MSLALTTIANDLESLLQSREEVLAGEMCGACLGTATMFNPCEACNSTGQVVNTAALEMIEEAIKQYSQELLPNKVDAYWWTLKKIGKKDDSKPLSQQTGMIADAKREIKRLQEMIDRLENLREFLSGCALQAISQRGGKPLEGTNGHKLRKQANGGVQPVEIVQPELVPEEFKRRTVTLNERLWNEMMAVACVAFENNGPMLCRLADAQRNSNEKAEPDKDAIRAALLKQEPCPACKGKGTEADYVGLEMRCVAVECSKCGGEGTISAGVPGATLAPRGEHLRIV